MKRPLPPHLPHWRSLLYVPANVPRFVERAHERGADAIILDLEDSVPPAQKAEARAALAEAAGKVARNGAGVLVRINQPLALAVPDIEAAIAAGVAGLMITKAAGASHLHLIDEMVSELETKYGLAPGGTMLFPVIETLRGFQAMAAIFAASARNVAALLGTEDFALDCGMEPDADTLAAPQQQLVIAARAAGLAPYGFIASIADFSDTARFREVVARSRRFGFAGAACIHPTQVRIVNEAYTPTPDEIERSERIVAADDAARRAGRGSASVDGRMIDAPVVERARRALHQAKRA